MDPLEKALEIALKAHRGQKDKAGAPYILHPLRVMMRMEEPLVMIAALLHDVIEDSETSLDDLRQAGIPQEVIEAVTALSRRSGESYEEFVMRAGANVIARKVKLADLKDNMDMARLSDLQPKDLERLAKYHRAYQTLKRIH
ncbi:MAG: HD domain-containing protein [bacterium]|nr:HD domain-containing protein [bacterium]